jgi:hypothetical protein
VHELNTVHARLIMMDPKVRYMRGCTAWGVPRLLARWELPLPRLHCNSHTSSLPVLRKPGSPLLAVLLLAASL